MAMHSPVDQVACTLTREEFYRVRDNVDQAERERVKQIDVEYRNFSEPLTPYPPVGDRLTSIFSKLRDELEQAI